MEAAVGPKLCYVEEGGGPSSAHPPVLGLPCGVRFGRDGCPPKARAMPTETHEACGWQGLLVVPQVDVAAGEKGQQAYQHRARVGDRSTDDQKRHGPPTPPDEHRRGASRYEPFGSPSSRSQAASIGRSDPARKAHGQSCRPRHPRPADPTLYASLPRSPLRTPGVVDAASTVVLEDPLVNTQSASAPARPAHLAK